MTDLGSITRLQEEQEKTLKNCEMMIEKWEKFQEEYTAVENLLTDLPKKTTHDVMVPIGPLAFMPGKLIHTNEIMVLLGDNWFAKRSASQACEIAKRRLKNVEGYLNNLRNEHDNILSHMAFTTDIANVKDQSDFREIKEELSEKDKQRLGQKNRRVAYPKATKDSVKKVDLKTVVGHNGLPPSSVGDKHLFARLDELEKRERMNNEMDDNVRGRTSNEKKDLKNSKDLIEKQGTKRVKWKEGLAEENGAGDERAAFPKDETATIKFTHTAVKLKTTSKEKDSQGIASPADIFNDYLRKKADVDKNLHEAQKPRSILKNSSDKDIGHGNKISLKKELAEASIPGSQDIATKEQPKTVEKEEKAKPAFADIVVEHKDVENSGESIKGQKEPRKMSKFKAGRMKNN